MVGRSSLGSCLFAGTLLLSASVVEAEPGLARLSSKAAASSSALPALTSPPRSPAHDEALIHQPSPFVSLPLENERALEPFFKALKAANKQHKVRVAFYGDSHTAPDLITSRLRAALQPRFGEAGAGFMLPAKPWKYHRHGQLEYVESKGFVGTRISKSVREGKFGLLGAALTIKGKKRGTALLKLRADLPASGKASDIELYYLKQPNGGRVRFSVDGKRIALISTALKPGVKPQSEAGYQRVHVEEGLHEIALETQGDGPVTLFGLTLEQEGGGVVVDTLGIPGARAKFHSLWNEPLYREHLQRRSPELFVLAYGTNEAGDEDLSLRDYEQTVRETVRRIQGYLPRASCLLVGPTDRPERQEDGTLAPRAAISAITEVQRKLASELNCAFFDVLKAMGGPMSIVRLTQHDPPLAQRDYVHLNQRGYELLGDALAESLLRAARVERD